MAEIFTSESSAKSSKKEGNYGKFCIFLTRGCGAVSAVGEILYVLSNMTWQIALGLPVMCLFIKMCW